MNILYCGDKNIIDGLYISILSLLKNVEEELHIYVLTIETEFQGTMIHGVPTTSIEFLNHVVKKENNKSFVKKIDITELFNKEIPEENMGTRFTPCCMLRLFADKLPELPEKILYLDNDVVCRRDCTKFYHQEVENYEVIGTLDYYGSWFFRNNLFKRDYLNSGVLLLNLKKIKETELFQKCRTRCQEKKMFMPDQSAINKLAISKKIMPRRYNEQRKMHKDTVLQHFTTSFRLFPWLHTVTIKPWNIEEVHNNLHITEYDDILEEYQRNKENLTKELVMEE